MKKITLFGIAGASLLLLAALIKNVIFWSHDIVLPAYGYFNEILALAFFIILIVFFYKLNQNVQ